MREQHFQHTGDTTVVFLRWQETPPGEERMGGLEDRQPSGAGRPPWRGEGDPRERQPAVARRPPPMGRWEERQPSQ
eukprot:9011396-Alexandrium_andersonii.AAC.1